MMQPLRIRLETEEGIVVDWSDGHRAVHRPGTLRLACPCAHCEDEWTGTRRVTEGDIPADIRALESRPVGRYGLQFVWSDGHSTGIYTFRRMRELCECALCRVPSQDGSRVADADIVPRGTPRPRRRESP